MVLSHHSECLALLHSPMFIGPCQRQRGPGWAFYPGQVALPLGQSRLLAHSWLGETRQMRCITHLIYPQVSEHCAACSMAAPQSRSLLSFSAQETCSLAKAVEAYTVKVCSAMPGLGGDAWQHRRHPELPRCRRERGQGAGDTSLRRAQRRSHRSWALAR